MIEYFTGNNFNIEIGSFSCPASTESLLLTFLSLFTPLMISSAYMVTVLVTISAIINEKITKMKEYLRLIGVRSSVIWICWMMRSFVIYLLLSIIVTLVSTYKFDYFYTDYDNQQSVNLKKSLFFNSSPSIVFLTMIIYSFQCTCLSLLVGQMFSKRKLELKLTLISLLIFIFLNLAFAAKAISIIFWFFTSINFYNSVSSEWKYFISVLPNTGLYFAIQIFNQYERSCKFSTLFAFRFK